MTQTAFTAFHHGRCIASGDLDAVVSAALAALAADSVEPLVFSDQTGAVQPLVPPRPAPAAPARGRPRLGVSAREVTLLPRHWDWLAAQPGGASATLRRLVEAAARAPEAPEAARRRAADAACAVISALAGDAPGAEAAVRALYAGDGEVFLRETQAWPGDVRDYLARLARPAFSGDPAPPA
ncbi:MAG: DUF2239 family protein [Phenylobacterium sp.]|uniref:DUF2239 family protein n=1 Tax=Phenylobacterium sp. TaxID=1871053 RepID=UPI0025F7DCA2|nr:DUF2239 family protein [Phenylobacterium sp.]MCA6223310.1 DUF2239 family protein [Phenylobacterium sp.]MCA6227103.1 DUF2239 family protein [Phenylobacterium sp.]MCA6233436.1 DUF2239 family protein [Phenylobacterium sp.]MCA6235484.1 DUF2239 family protein [Phenylobacterium sp.]MCA6249998.1 DUF2239 family protein [Phenylobacterium sp.]